MKQQLYVFPMLLMTLFFPFISEAQKVNENVVNSGIKQSGYTNITEVDFGIRVGNYPEYRKSLSWGIQTVNGYLFSPNFSMGLGLGAFNNDGLIFGAIFLDVRVNFLKTKTTPFISVAYGNADNIPEGYKGGRFFNPSFGIKHFVTSKTALNFSIGYRLQENKGYHETMRYLDFKFGATF